MKKKIFVKARSKKEPYLVVKKAASGDLKKESSVSPESDKSDKFVIQTIPSLSNILKSINSASSSNSYLLGFGNDDVL